jgi:hypothetical protein
MIIIHNIDWSISYEFSGSIKFTLLEPVSPTIARSEI